MDRTKPKMYLMIRLGRSNEEIAELFNTTSAEVRRIRRDYNKHSNTVFYSRRTRPRLGTINREIYEALTANRGMSQVELSKKFGFRKSEVSKVYCRYLKG